jgi:hypothetical protein
MANMTSAFEIFFLLACRLKLRAFFATLTANDSKNSIKISTASLLTSIAPVSAINCRIGAFAKYLFLGMFFTSVFNAQSVFDVLRDLEHSNDYCVAGVLNLVSTCF